jgi:hypothetical protein
VKVILETPDKQVLKLRERTGFKRLVIKKVFELNNALSEFT